MAGLAIGRTTRSRVRRSPQPSIRAASMYSLGMVSRNWRSRKMENASPKAIGMMSGQSEPLRPICLAQNRYIGMTVTCGGSIIIAMTAISARLRPRKRNLASA